MIPSHGLKRGDWTNPIFGLSKRPEIGNQAIVHPVCTSCQTTEEMTWKSLASQINRRTIVTTVRLCNRCYIKSTERDPVLAVFRTEEHRTALALISATAWRDESYAANQRTIRSDPEYKKAASERSRSFWKNDEYRQRIVESAIAQWSSVDNREALSRSIKRAWTRAEYRERYALARSTPEYAERRSEISAAMWRNEKFRERMSAMSKSLWNDDNFRSHMAVMLAEQPRISSIQTTLYKYLDDLGVVYEKESEKTVIGPWAFDCLVPGSNGRKNLLIEAQGNYWHSLPKGARNDRSKFTYISRYFPDHEIMYVWEHEFKTEGRVLDRLKQKLGIQLSSIDFEFSDVIYKKIDYRACSTFLSYYHYLSKNCGGQCFGAFLGDDLIAVAVFSKGIRQNSTTSSITDCTEFSRFCIHPAYHKRNFAGWIASKFIGLNGSSSVIAYADTTVGHSGTMYKAIGFIEHHRTESDYWYVDASGWVMHKKTLYNHACRIKMTESEFMKKFEYQKRWGGPKICYLWSKR